MQVGSLKKLPDDFVGERHVVVVKRRQTSTPNYESCEFEERPGPQPPGICDQACRIYVAEEDRGLLCRWQSEKGPFWRRGGPYVYAESFPLIRKVALERPGAVKGAPLLGAA